MQAMEFGCDVYPVDLKVTASLGNVTAIDPALPEGNPYRIAAKPRSGSSTSLIKVLAIRGLQNRVVNRLNPTAWNTIVVLDLTGNHWKLKPRDA